MVYAYLFLFIACQEILRSRSFFYLTTCDLFESWCINRGVCFISVKRTLGEMFEPLAMVDRFFSDRVWG